MDTSTAVVLVVALFAVVIIAAIAVYRRRIRAGIKTPFGQLNLEGSNEPPASRPGASIKDVESRRGGVLADDHTGRGAEVSTAKAEKDIVARSAPPSEETGPKAKPPA